ncbi:MAG: glycosyltransferase, partial [Planctomycetota bacterium]
MTAASPVPVLHVHDRSAWGGNIEHIRQLCRGLDAQRFHAMAAGPPKEAWTQRLADEGIPVFPSQIESKWDVGAAVRLSRLLRSKRVGIVHTHIRRADLMGSIAAGLARPTRAIATLHGLVCVDERGVERFGVSERVYAKVLRHGFDRVITVSAAVRAEAIERLGLPPEHVVHVVNGTDLARFEIPPARSDARAAAGLTGDEIGIGMVSRFVAAGSHMKGHAELVHAFAQLVPDHPCARLLLIGDGPSRPEIEDLAKQLGVQAAV